MERIVSVVEIASFTVNEHFNARESLAPYEAAVRRVYHPEYTCWSCRLRLAACAAHQIYHQNQYFMLLGPIIRPLRGDS